ncbi:MULTISPECIES: ATP-binding protein [unclassified Streptomyces]|uniref:ATP-binding protein n=1 Tax=unclassified Streptomyces TaxID=2593676 RepID=UPI00093B7AD8|nr:hypothetical protein [Streptomyces sp. CB01883]OKJ80847.1 hypothetical protein AMK32_24215 [Streptomyces sp. CB01883]
MLNRFSDVPDDLIGRANELTLLTGSLGGGRLVTLTGVGGVGKSRLALHAADRVRRFDGRAVAWADLWQLRDDRLLLPLVADALGFADHTYGEPVDSLAGWLSGQDQLLVLDSCEHLTSSCRALVTRLRSSCPRLTVLATSREPLGISGEQVVGTEPLPVDTDAVELLSRRAAALGVPLTRPEDRVAAARLCRWLDGIPLALEMAAGQLAGATLGEIEHHVRSRLDLTAAAYGPAAPSHHRALRTTIGWSHELCEPSERLLWARLSVFRGPFDAEAALHVCEDDALPATAVRACLDALERKSVLTRHGDRHRMLDTVREYGHLWLAELGEEPEARSRHARYFRARVRKADEEWQSAAQTHWYRWIEDSHADLCAALDHLTSTGSAAALDMSGRLGFFWSCGGHLREAAAYLEDCLARCPAPAEVRVRALWALGVTRVLCGDGAAARELAERCSWEADRCADADGSLRAAYLLALIHLLDGRPMAAGHAVDLALGRATGSTDVTAATVLCRLARVFALTGQGFLGRARAGALELRADCAERGEWWGRSYADYQLSLIALFEDRSTDAVAHARSMVEGKHRIGDTFGMALGLDLLAAALAAQGTGEPAAAAYALGEVLWSAVGHPQRGTPELGPVRAQCERTTRALLGTERYEAVLARSAARDPETVLGEIMGPSWPAA